MFCNLNRQIAPFVLLAFLIAAWQFAFSQSIGSKDLSHPIAVSQPSVRAPTDEYCVPSGGVVDGVMIKSDDSPIVTLYIEEAKLLFESGRPRIELTLILKNHGIGPVLIPWSAVPVEEAGIPQSSKSAGKDNRETGYDVATTDFFVGKPFSPQENLALRGQVALWAQPNNPAQNITVQAGQWVELKTSVDVLCRLSDATQCVAQLRKDKLQISAWWYRRLLTKTTKGACIYQNGAYTEDEISSKTAEVSGTPIDTSQPVLFTSVTSSGEQR